MLEDDVRWLTLHVLSLWFGIPLNYCGGLRLDFTESTQTIHLLFDLLNLAEEIIDLGYEFLFGLNRKGLSSAF